MVEKGKRGSTGLTMFATCQRSVLCVPTKPTAWNIVWKPVLRTEFVPSKHQSKKKKKREETKSHKLRSL